MDLTNLISYWGLDESSGSRADRHGTNTMSEAGTVGTSTGKVYALAADLTGANGFFLSDNASVSVSGAAQEYTIALWVKMGSLAATARLVSKGTSPDTSFYVEYNLGSNRFAFSNFEGAGGLNPHSVDATSMGAPSTGTWYFIVAWRDSSGNNRIQVNDGTVDLGSGQNATAYDEGGEFDIGFTDGIGNFATCTIGPVMFWKRVLTAQERTDLYNGGSGLTYAAMSSSPAASSPWGVIQHIVRRPNVRVVSSGMTPPDFPSP